MVWEGMDTQSYPRNLLSLFVCSVLPSVRVVIIKSIFSQPHFQMPLSLKIHNLFPFKINLKSEIFTFPLMRELITEIPPGILELGAVAFAFERVLPDCQCSARALV